MLPCGDVGDGRNGWTGSEAKPNDTIDQVPLNRISVRERFPTGRLPGKNQILVTRVRVGGILEDWYEGALLL